MPKCRYCGEEFKSKNKNHRFCSGECRALYWKSRKLKHRDSGKWPYSPAYEYSYQGVPVLRKGKTLYIWDDNMSKYLSEDEFYSLNEEGESNNVTNNS